VEVVRLTLPVKLFTLDKDNSDLPEPPCEMVRNPGLKEMEKSGPII
jgi:hypothetical protein